MLSNDTPIQNIDTSTKTFSHFPVGKSQFRKRHQSTEGGSVSLKSFRKTVNWLKPPDLSYISTHRLKTRIPSRPKQTVSTRIPCFIARAKVRDGIKKCVRPNIFLRLTARLFQIDGRNVFDDESLDCYRVIRVKISHSLPLLNPPLNFGFASGLQFFVWLHVAPCHFECGYLCVVTKFHPNRAGNASSRTINSIDSTRELHIASKCSDLTRQC